MCLFNSAFADTHAKLSKYFVDGGQPASKVLQQMRMLDPRNLINVERNFDFIMASLDLKQFQEMSGTFMSTALVLWLSNTAGMVAST